jgi:F0F1-type ATP synthase membrane subunit b/b'
VIPDWLEPYRLLGTLLIWLILPLQLYSIYRNRTLYRQWETDEAARRDRWKEDMTAVNRLREEAYHLRAQAEVALAQARRQAFKDGSAGGSNVPGGP